MLGPHNPAKSIINKKLIIENNNKNRNKKVCNRNLDSGMASYKSHQSYLTVK
jgi:hypothetical protein